MNKRSLEIFLNMAQAKNPDLNAIHSFAVQLRDEQDRTQLEAMCLMFCYLRTDDRTDFLNTAIKELASAS